MQRISGTISRSPSNTSVASITSVYSWGHSSGDAAHYSMLGSSPSPVPVTLEEEEEEAHLTRSSRLGFRQARQRSHSDPKANINLHQTQLQGRWGGPPPRSNSTTRLIPSAPSLCSAVKPLGMPAHSLRRDSRIGFLDYKVQELLDWHVHRKHRQKEVVPSPRAPSPKGRARAGSATIPKGGILQWVSQQLSICPRPGSHTPPPALPQRCQTPPKASHVRSPGPCPRTPGPPPEDFLAPPNLFCKSGSCSSLRGQAEGKMGSGAAKEGLGGIFSLLGQSKSPPLPKDPGRPRTRKGKERDSRARRSPSTPKEARAGSPKDKPTEIEVSAMVDRKVCWGDALPDATEAHIAFEQWSTVLPPLLDPSFMCQNQLELPCMTAARVELHHENNRRAVLPPKPQCLAHSIVESLDTDQATRDLHLCLAKTLEKGRGRLSVEYPVCLLCGRCTPYCPHPRPRHSPSLLVYPRLSVREGEVHMCLGFLLKIKRSEASEWGLLQAVGASKRPLGKEGPPRYERSRSRHRKSRGAETQPQSPEKAPRLPKQQPPAQGGDPRARGRRSVPRRSPQPSKRRHQPQLGKPASSAAAAWVHAKPPKNPPSVLKQLLLYIKNAWAKMRGRAPKEQGSTASLCKLGGALGPPGTLGVPSATASEPHNQGGILLHRQGSRPMVGSYKELLPPAGQASALGHWRVSLNLDEPEAPRAPKKGESRHTKAASSGASKKLARQSSPAQTRKAPSKQASRRDNMY
ncbi:uncharacterized protein LOC133384575 [Rhineura floridana]|uniref:uncharacterized protein LOC133384575 n=1 Tax=Rhineura floridana TaxID=261503 RepID=UPI002AC7F4C7|nr:uncharacterized protein LOC133384575 [Rhineura floridana]